MKILVLCGLPGSGKTSFAEKLSKEGTKIYDFDKLIIEKELTLEEIFERIKEEKSSICVADGLFLTQKDYELFASIFKDGKIEFHFWREDRVQCLKNIKNRKDKKAHITIKHAVLEKPDMIKLNKLHKHYTLVEHEVYKG